MNTTAYNATQLRARAHRAGVLLLCLGGWLASGCGETPQPPSGSGGAYGSGGAQGTGGAQGAGGVLATGGVQPGGGATGTGGATTTSTNSDAAREGTGGIRDAGAVSNEVAAPAECPAPPAEAPADAIAALNAENTLRVAMKVPCANLVLSLCTAAQKYCDDYTTNQGSSTCEASSAHSEVSGCPGFTGADAGTRVKAAGYTGSGWSECMAFAGNPAGAVKMFVDSVYHRVPVLSPWYTDMGYGGGTGCDIMDFGPGSAAAAKTLTAFYPYDGQVGVPLSFNGAQEGPTPPAPTTGWPSGYPVILYGQGITVTSHQIVVDGTTTPLAHIWLDGDKTLGSLAKVLYTEAPLSANTSYRVTIDGSNSTGSLHFDWAFTTGAGSTRPGRRG
jgi:hypothetical protein